MQIIDYNGEGRWSRGELLRRYAEYARDLSISPRDLSPAEHEAGDRKWVYPVMHKVVKGIYAGDQACIRLGIEFIEEDAGFPFGRIIKSNTARALRHATLTDEQKRRIRRRVLGMLADGYVPREYKEYAKLLRRIGLDMNELGAIAGQSDLGNPRIARFYHYFLHLVR